MVTVVGHILFWATFATGCGTVGVGVYFVGHKIALKIKDMIHKGK